jgi:hypothetical protein
MTMSECDDDEGLSFQGVINTAEVCLDEAGGDQDRAVSWARKLRGLHGERTVRQIIQIINLRFRPPPRRRDEVEEEEAAD